MRSARERTRACCIGPGRTHQPRACIYCWKQVGLLGHMGHGYLQRTAVEAGAACMDRPDRSFLAGRGVARPALHPPRMHVPRMHTRRSGPARAHACVSTYRIFNCWVSSDTCTGLTFGAVHTSLQVRVSLTALPEVRAHIQRYSQAQAAHMSKRVPQPSASMPGVAGRPALWSPALAGFGDGDSTGAFSLPAAT